MTDTNTNGRLPRYNRAEADVYFDLTARDIQILQTTESFRLLTSEHLAALIHGSDQGILRRLQKVFHAGLLDRLRPRRVENGGSAKMVYAITNKGVQTLQKEGLIQKRTKTDLNAQNKEVGVLYIAHTLLVSHIRTVLTAACKRHPGLELLFWREGRELQHSIEVALPDRYAQIPVAPDGFFALGDAQGRRAHFFVEADRGPMSLKRFTRKLQAYGAWWRAKKHVEKLGIKTFRVLTVTSSAARCRNLVQAAAAADDIRGDARLFLFTTEEKLSLARPESIFEKIWTVPASAEPHALFGQVLSEHPNKKEGITPMPQNPNANTEVRHGP